MTIVSDRAVRRRPLGFRQNHTSRRRCLGEGARQIWVMLMACLVLALPAQLRAADTGPVAGQVAASPEELSVTRPESVTVGGRTLRFHTTAGTITVRDGQGKPRLSTFYTAYTLETDQSHSQRPVTFLFNGGPGSSSLWLHMGSFGPKRVVTPDAAFTAPAPYAFAANPNTLIGTTDLVFIDAPGTGYSRALGDARPGDFYSVDADIDAFVGSIQRYLTKFDRWGSPKFLLGESYGATRAAMLGYRLQAKGTQLNGIILLSAALDIARFDTSLDCFYQSFLPTYAATTWFHDRVPGGRPASLADFIAEARRFTNGPYAAALAQGNDIPDADLDRVAAAMSRYTGLSPDYIRAARLRVEPDRFRKALLRDRNLALGELDTRYVGADADPNAAAPDDDPSYRAVQSAYVSSFHEYIGRQIGFRTSLNYNLAASYGGEFTFNYSHRAPNGQLQYVVNALPDLAAALRLNPHLKVLTLSGHYDLSTPFNGTDIDLSRLVVDPAQRTNVATVYFDAGHMAYASPVALGTVAPAIERFMRDALSPP